MKAPPLWSVQRRLIGNKRWINGYARFATEREAIRWLERLSKERSDYEFRIKQLTYEALKTESGISGK